MKPVRLRTFSAILMLSVLFLAACQPALLGSMNPPSESDGAAEQALEVNTEAPTSEPTEEVSLPAPTRERTALSPAAIKVPEDWPVLNTTKGYSLAYSLDWEICQNTIYSWTFCDSQKDLAGIGHQLRLYVSVFPNDYPNSDWEVYNFIPTDTIRAFMALPVGESMQKVPGSPRPAYNTYKRLPDQMVAGWNAPVIENSNVWGLPAGTTDRIVFIVTHETTYMLGMYYESLEQLTMFEQVLDSFQFAP